MVEKSIQSTIPSGLKAGLGWVAAEKIPWAAIGGLEDVKRKLLRAIDWPLRERESCGPGNEEERILFILFTLHMVYVNQQLAYMETAQVVTPLRLNAVKNTSVVQQC